MTLPETDKTRWPAEASTGSCQVEFYRKFPLPGFSAIYGH